MNAKEHVKDIVINGLLFLRGNTEYARDLYTILLFLYDKQSVHFYIDSVHVFKIHEFYMSLWGPHLLLLFIIILIIIIYYYNYKYYYNIIH